MALAHTAHAQSTTSTSTSSTSTSTSSTTSTTLLSGLNTGSFLTTAAVTGPGTKIYCVRSRDQVHVLTADATISGTGTVKLENKINGGANWVPIDSGVTATGRIRELEPSGCYRANVTACSGCTIGPVTWEWH
jgi:hypothetical protein